MKNYRKYLNPEEQTGDRCCEDPRIDIRGGNQVCLNCGLVLDVYLVENERRAFNKEEIEKRKQTEPRWRDFGSRTILPKSKLDYKGHFLNFDLISIFIIIHL